MLAISHHENQCFAFKSLSYCHCINCHFYITAPLLVLPVMAPVPKPEPVNLLHPIQHNWDKISPTLSTYNQVLGGLGTIFSFASAIALIVSHDFRFPKWPFTQDRWYPKPDVDKTEAESKDEVTEEQIIEDELAEVAAGLAKRSVHARELKWVDRELVSDDLQRRKLLRSADLLTTGDELDEFLQEIEQEVEEIAETIKETTAEIYNDVKPGLGEIVDGAREVGDRIVDDLADLFNQNKNATKGTNGTQKGEVARSTMKTRRAFRY